MIHGAKWSRREWFAGSAATALGLASANSAAFAQSPRAAGPGVERAPELDQFQLAGVPDETYWRKIRAQFSLRDDLAFLNTGTCGPVSRPVLDVQDHYSRELARDPSNNFRSSELSSVRRRLAAFVNASPEEIALTHSTTEGVNLFAHGLDWKPGDEVVLGTQEHFSVHEAYLWVEKRYGARIVWADIPAAAESVEQVVAIYAKAITPRTKVVVLSEVAYTSGLRLPLKELSDLAHNRGALVSVDGAQSFGVVPLDLKAIGVDHYAAPGQKWLLAGTGTGFSFIRKDVQEQVWPLAGYVDAKGSGGKGAPPGNRFERSGQVNIPATTGVAAAVDFQNAIGKDNIHARSLQLTGQLRDGLKRIAGVTQVTSSDPRLSAALTVFSIHGVPAQPALKWLAEHERIQIRAIKDGGVDAIRASTHFYNTPQEVDRLLSGVSYLAEHSAQFASPVAS
jgi:selenocysteine lyase/cysteine desulfurase